MISFVIVAYNAEKTIEKAINSILNQEKTKLEYEIIVVNDGSTDKTSEKVAKYNLKVKCYNKENSGVADARNYGVKKAQGEYIIFVDSDDYISKTLLKDIEIYINEGVDLIKWSPIFVKENKFDKKDKISFEKVTGEEGFNLLFGKDKLIDCLWDYAIKKETILEFPSGAYHEDFAVMPLIILKAKSMVAIDKYEYYYVQSTNSIMRNSDEEKSKKKLQDKLHHFDTIIKEIEKIQINKKTKENVKIYITNALLIIVPDLKGNNKNWFEKELKKRKVSKYIKVRNIKQLIKRIILEFKY